MNSGFILFTLFGAIVLFFADLAVWNVYRPANQRIGHWSNIFRIGAYVALGICVVLTSQWLAGKILPESRFFSAVCQFSAAMAMFLVALGQLRIAGGNIVLAIQDILFSKNSVIGNAEYKFVFPGFAFLWFHEKIYGDPIDIDRGIEHSFPMQIEYLRDTDSDRKEVIGLLDIKILFTFKPDTDNLQNFVQVGQKTDERINFLKTVLTGAIQDYVNVKFSRESLANIRSDKTLRNDLNEHFRENQDDAEQPIWQLYGIKIYKVLITEVNLEANEQRALEKAAVMEAQAKTVGLMAREWGFDLKEMKPEERLALVEELHKRIQAESGARTVIDFNSSGDSSDKLVAAFMGALPKVGAENQKKNSKNKDSK